MSDNTHFATPPDEHTPLGFERIVFFSDAVMAIAITLLVIDLKIPEISISLAAEQLPARLAELTPRIISFVISFAVVGVYWSSHHRYFTYIKRYDRRLISLNSDFYQIFSGLQGLLLLAGARVAVDLPKKQSKRSRQRR